MDIQTRTHGLPKNKFQLRLKKYDFNKRTGLPHRKKVTRIVMITSFPPRECGIATYSKDLMESLANSFPESFEITICALNNSMENHTYSDGVSHVLQTDDVFSFDTIASKINKDATIGMVMIQHEFGLFNANPAKFIDFIKTIDKPKAIVFHTVLPNPDKAMKAYTKSIMENVQQIVVMTDGSKALLQNFYNGKPDAIQVIRHGTHLVPHKNVQKLKEKYGYEGRTILSTFGLLGPGKSIETTLDALPNLIKKYPDLLFLIIGKTHPNLVNTDGERYRNSLLEKVETLELQDHVEFINRFVPLENLLDYLQLTDIYLFTSNNPHQAVSGTFAYALSCGCPIVSTPIPHAVEVLNGDGLFFEFGNSTGLSKQIDRLLNDSNLRHIYRMNGLHNASSTAWQNSAIAHAKLFESLNPKCQITYTYPKLEFRHMRNLTTSTGIIQFSQLNHPDLSSGYTLDDNARALVVMCMHYKQQKNKQCILDMITYLSFVLNCQRHGGEFLNYVDEHKQFTVQNDTVNLEDANGRAIWALGQVIGLNHLLPFDYDFLIEKAEDALNDYLPNSIHVTSPRAMAFIIKGLYYANQTLDRKDIVCLVEHLANRLVKHYRDTSEEKWQWFEKYFTYGNSVLPEALLMAHEMTETKEFKTIAKSSFDFLLTHMSTDTSFRAISNRSWFQKGNDLTEHQWGGQQAIDVAYTILALQLFHTNYPKNGYDAQMKKAFSWFLGNNHLNQSIYNHCTGGCHDGIETHNVNLNQGAESMVSYLLSRLCMEEV